MTRRFPFFIFLGSVCVAAVANSASAADKPEGKPISGFRFVNGVYVPNESYVEGQTRATGLQQAFPAMKSLAENPMTPEKVELGKLLYFDPVLSGENTISCAHCHHPDYGFTDGRNTSMGKGGKGVGPERNGGDVLKRGAPTIWNSAYSPLQFWDGRAKDLEQQAEGPIQDAHEMAQNADELIKELKGIPEYVQLFQKTFGGSADEAVTFRHVTLAIAAFERTLLSFNSKYDRYAAGDSGALNEQEKRGLALFRSLKTRCFECHTLPNFSDGSFRVIGVPDEAEHDPGRAKVPGQGPDGAFKIPTLRNVALTAPYMHTGRFKTLEEVIDFYSKGGGRQFEKQIPGIDDKIGKFDITPAEVSDLVAFLNALTDTSLQPEPPVKVPSGLPVVEVKTKAIPAPPLTQIASASVPTSSITPSSSALSEAPSALQAARQAAFARFSPGTQGPGTQGIVPSRLHPRSRSVSATLRVMPGQSIQAALDRSQFGDRVEVMPGVYHQTVAMDRDGIEVAGLVVNGERAVLDGQNALADAVQGTGNDCALEGFVIRNYTGNGVVFNKANNVVFRDLVVENSGLYAVYPVECKGVLIEECVVSGAKDAGIYVGQSRDIIVRNNEVFHNVAGLEIENSVNALVTNNSAHHNTGGILVFLLPAGASKVGSHCRVIGNRVWENNTANFAKPGSIVSYLPPGTGMLVMAADNTEVTGNQIYGNNSSGITLMSFLTSASASKEKYELDIEPNSDNNLIHDNSYRDNGKNPAPLLKAMGVPGADLTWDGTGVGNGWREQAGVKTYPEKLPDQSGFAPFEVSVLGGI